MIVINFWSNSSHWDDTILYNEPIESNEINSLFKYYNG
jgi:hypothetical protein